MKIYIYKVLIAAIAIILVFKFTIGNEVAQINQKINFISSNEGRKQILESLKKEIRKANQRENYLDEEERILLKSFIKKIQKELE
tara:strand:- start:76 stop:330 length:255 start_codon:yes stop_codon:yes gene_type:complete